MGSAAVEKTAAELRKEIDELLRQQRKISERIRDSRGLRRGGLSGNEPQSFRASGARQRVFVRPADRTYNQDQPPPKRRLSSAIVKVDDGETIEDAGAEKDLKGEDSMDFEDGATEHVPRVSSKVEEPSLVNRNKRILYRLLGTLEKFRKEDLQLSGTEAYMRRSNSLQRAEQKAREESEWLRQQEREEIAEKRRRDVTLRARITAKAEEKKLFLQWSEHHKKLCNFQRTKAQPPIYYAFNNRLEEDATLIEQRKEQAYSEWKAVRREELSEYQKRIKEEIVEKELEKFVSKIRKFPNLNLQKTMDKELETHRLEHNPKKSKISGGSNNNEDDDDDVEDINVGEDEEDMMDDVVDVDDSTTMKSTGDETYLFF